MTQDQKTPVIPKAMTTHKHQPNRNIIINVAQTTTMYYLPLANGKKNIFLGKNFLPRNPSQHLFPLRLFMIHCKPQTIKTSR